LEALREVASQAELQLELLKKSRIWVDKEMTIVAALHLPIYMFTIQNPFIRSETVSFIALRIISPLV
jgi:hypothetical protein